MAIGPGKYDDVVTEIRERLKAEGVLLVVVNGTKGSGFSAQLSLELTVQLPEALREIATQIDAGGLAI